ncbi:MAG: tyrosine-type recombinase/integrase [Methylovulum sp.]|nr:tyrosine-type recombinase/integrase [Methylovulum sp.]MCF7998486.1 tyrosine-type recombinase/integrase [Methylovulum sp.]
MALTDSQIRSAKYQQDKPNQKLSDGGGLHLLITKTSKLWRFSYRFGDKQKTLALGKYPLISLAKARMKQLEAKQLLSEGIDPSNERKTDKVAQTEVFATFKDVALEWHEKQKSRWSEGHTDLVKWRLTKYVMPYLGNMPIKDIVPKDMLDVMRVLEVRDRIETAHRVGQICSQIFRYGVASLQCERDITSDLRGSLKSVRVKNFASIKEPTEIGKLLRAIDGYQGEVLTRLALRLLPLVFVRPGELRHAEWSEVNFDASEWHIPAEKMKMRDPHIVPLSKQAVAIFREVQQLAGGGKYIFPSVRSNQRVMSENTLNAALRRLDYTKEQMTSHGFRSMASTRLNEMLINDPSCSFNADIIERQLAHKERNSVRGVYNHAQYLPERRKMMQVWADYLDKLKLGENKT